MHDKHEKEDPLVDLGYETRDLNMGPLVKAVMAFFVFVTATYIIAIPIFRLFNPQIANGETISAPFARKPPEAPNPLLQTNVTTKTDIMDLRKAETAQLTTSGTIDAKAGVYRIPVDRAIDLVAKRGLPEKPSAGVTSGAK